MQLRILPGKYVMAVSGGVDSVVLLDILAKQANSQKEYGLSYQLIVAHLNHGIREDSSEDERLVKDLARKYGLELEVAHARLGPDANEDRARMARYKFLRGLKKKHRATSIITGHHQDDLIETALLNILRGTGRRGLSAIADSDVRRPLLDTSKKTIIEYAQLNGLRWREDSTNQDTSHSRNYLRHEILANLTDSDRSAIIDNIERIAKTNKLLNRQIATLSHKIKQQDIINRSKFTQLPQEIANELIIRWLRENDIRTYDRKSIHRLSMAIKTGLPNTRQQVGRGLWLEIGTKTAQVTTSG